MINIQANDIRIKIGSEVFPKNKYTVTLFDNYVRVKFIESSKEINLRYEEVTIEGMEAESNEQLYNYLDANSFKAGGGALGEGVQSVTGDLVDDTDPNNPKINMVKIDQGSFLVGGAINNEQRKILPSDIGVSSPFSLPYTGSDIDNFQSGGLPFTSSNDPDTMVYRTSSGAGKFTPASSPDEAVVLSQHQTDLELKVDKVAGKGLSDANFTTAEKDKLAGLEDVHYKGWFTSLASLEAAHHAPEEGSHALVDDPSGSSVYIWKTDVEPPLWDARVGESTELTPAQSKVLYESNPDTNAFTDDLKNKLEAFTANFTSALKTAYDNAVSWISINGANILNHLSNKSNPHEVTASQIGLGNVDNTSDANKPISIAAQAALDNKVNFPATNGHIPVRTSTGLQGSQPFTSAITGNTMMFRDSNGRSHVASPTENTHIVNKAYADRVWMPDYSNMETTNMITTHGGTWTVPSGRRGWVKLYTRTYTGGVLDAEVFLINGKVMENIWHEATSGTGTARSGSRSGLFQVKGGDTVQVHGNLERSCYFIPGIWV